MYNIVAAALNDRQQNEKDQITEDFFNRLAALVSKHAEQLNPKMSIVYMLIRKG